ncbi:RING/U-box superfamily protein isoform X2 [Wolffia australiana]
MSSSPIDGQGSASNSSRPPLETLYSSHGNSRDDLDSGDGRAGGVGFEGIGSGQIDSFVGGAAPAGANSSVFGSFEDLSQKVADLGLTEDIGNPTRGTRGQSHNVDQSGLSNAQTEGFDGFRSSPTQSAGRRNQSVNANYLLNFHFDPISRPAPRKPPTPKKQPKARPYNKDLFLQANYKFFVLDTGEYCRGSMDPDKMLEWEDIVCVRYLTPFEVHCPICLESPISPQITSCGHIFCFPCILQYLLMKGDVWERCPLCFTMISAKDLYTVHIHNVRPHNVGDHVQLTLLMRARDSSVPLQKNNRKFESASCGDDVWDSFTKFTLTSDVELSVREARRDLDDWLAKVNAGLVDDLERLPYVCAALEQLDKRMQTWADHRSFSGSPPSDSALSDSIATARGIQKLGSPEKSEPYFFYQSVDGQHLILHPLNMKCLLHHYKSYDALPERIEGKILELETVAQSEATRRRYRFLSHLPLTTSFQLCELSLREALPAEALSPFMDEIKKREKQRKQVAKKEQEERAIAQASEWTAGPVTGSDHSRSSQPFSLDDFEALGGPAGLSTSPPVAGEKKSFSDVARLGFASRHDSPLIWGGRPSEPTPEPGSEPSTARHAGGATSFAGIVGKKGKKQAKVLLSTAGGRRY